MNTAEYVHLSCADTAKLVRKALKDKFPGVKFSVRSETYSMGASIHVSYTDGPKPGDVESVTNNFLGADFDGMIDLKSYNKHWMDPDGTVYLAHAQGTEGSKGSQPERFGSPRNPDAKLVSLGADFVFVNREISDEWQAEIFELFTSITGREIGSDKWGPSWQTQLPLNVDRNTGELHHMVEHETEDLSALFHRYTRVRDRA